LWGKRNLQKTLENLKDALTYAEQGLKDRWEWYKEKFKRWVKIMTKKEYIERNIGMPFDFIKQLIDHPEAIESIPDGTEIDFID